MFSDYFVRWAEGFRAVLITKKKGERPTCAGYDTLSEVVSAMGNDQTQVVWFVSPNACVSNRAHGVTKGQALRVLETATDW
jgi:hypothetical protein